ncbi:hypothetical protein ACFC0K_15685 [Streptomyces hydrogenans]
MLAGLAFAVLLAAGARLVVWALRGEPGRRRPCSLDGCSGCQARFGP